MVNQSRLINLIQKSLAKGNRSRNSGGAECVFIPISKQRGIKLYKKSKWANISFHTQNRYSKKGIAPKVFGKINTYTSDNKYRTDHFYLQKGKGYSFFVTERVRQCGQSPTEKKLDGIVTRLPETFNIDEMIKMRNLGYKRGKLLFVDWGNYSSSSSSSSSS